jgi:hypothetical protein
MTTKIVCNVPRVSCYQTDCEMCSGAEKLNKKIEQSFEDISILSTD